MGDGEDQVGVAGRVGEDRAGVDQRAARAHGDVRLLQHQDDRGVLRGLQGRGVVAPVAEQLGPGGVRGPLGAEREVRDPGERRCFTHHDLEGAHPVEAGEQLAGEEQRLGGGPGRDERHRPAARAAQQRRRPLERLVPVGGVQRAPVALDERGLDPVAAVHPAVGDAPVVAHEVAVHLDVGPRAEPHHDVLARVDGDVAALRAPGADRGRLVELPGPRLVQEVFREERAHGAQVHHVPRPGVVEPRLGVDADVGPVAALRHVEHRLLRYVLHEAHAPRAQDAAVGDVEHVGPEVLHRVEALRELRAVPRAATPLLEGEVLQLALARLVADRAIERVVDEEQLQHSHARALCLRVLGVHHHALGDRRGAGDLELRRLLDLDEAHAAHARHRQSRMVAVVRDEDARLLRRLDHERPLRHLDGNAVDRQVDEVATHSPIPHPASRIP